MKNVQLFLITSLLFLVFTMNAQIIVTQDHLPVVGDVVVSAQSDTLDVVAGTAGADQVWDYSLMDTMSYDTVNYISPLDAPNNADFPDANLAGAFISEGDSVYFFLESTPDAFWRLGGVLRVDMIPDAISLPLSPKSKQFELPGTYGTSFNDSTSYEVEATVDGTLGRIKNVTLTQNTIDGYGMITTAEGTFNALRMVSTTQSVDSTWIFVFGTWNLVLSEQSETTTVTYLTRETKGPIVVLEIAEDGHVSNASHVIGYTPQEWAPVAAFSSEDGGDGEISFTDESSDSPTSWLWDFGNGETSSEQNPVNTYTLNGTYDICLTVTNSVGANMVCQEIIISLPPTSDFEYADQGSGEIHFGDLSINDPISWVWDFGDGNTSTEQNPQYIYIDNGTYNVCLTVTNAEGTNTYCEMVDVVVVGVNDLAAPIALEIFPNPVSDFVTFKINEVINSQLQVNITDAQGKTIFKGQLANKQTINTSSWPAGIYSFRVFTSDEKASTSGQILVTK